MKARIMCLILTLFVFVACESEKEQHFDNECNYYDVITRTYTKEDIDDLNKQLYTSVVTYNQFEKQFIVECMRKTEYHYYVILLQDDGTRVFLFFDTDTMVLRNIYSVKNFKTKKEVEEHLAIQSNITKKTVLQFDENTYFMEFNSVESTAHYVDEGVFIIQYERTIDGIDNNSLVSEIDFFSNVDESVFAQLGIPYILPIDKS